jgi:hypothetical protein
MIPIRDSIAPVHTPFVNNTIIAICACAFLWELMSGNGGQQVIERFGMVPLRLSDADAVASIPIREMVQTPIGPMVRETSQVLAPSAIAPWLTLITCMFLHGGWMHFLGNMWFLHVFGDNVEDRFGHFGYLMLYIGTGVLAGLAHWAAESDSPIPTVGASGAIAGVMGAYALLYPHAKVLSVLPIFIFLQTFVVPAPIFLGIWFAIQMFSGIASSAGSTGVAWWAHIGGFVAGIGLAMLVKMVDYGRTETTLASREHRF